MLEQHLAHSCCSISVCLPIPQIHLLGLFCSVILPSSSLTGLLWLYVVGEKSKSNFSDFHWKIYGNFMLMFPVLAALTSCLNMTKGHFFSWNTFFQPPEPKHFVLTPWTLNLERFKEESEILWGEGTLLEVTWWAGAESGTEPRSPSPSSAQPASHCSGNCEGCASPANHLQRAQPLPGHGWLWPDGWHDLDTCVSRPKQLFKNLVLQGLIFLWPRGIWH